MAADFVAKGFGIALPNVLIGAIRDNFSGPSLTKEKMPASPPLRYSENTMLQRVVKRFLKSEGGQGLSEYCLISALLAILGLGIYLMAGGGKALTQDDSANVQTSSARR